MHIYPEVVLDLEVVGMRSLAVIIKKSHPKAHTGSIPKTHLGPDPGQTELQR